MSPLSMPMYGTQHLLVLAFTVIATAAVIPLARRLPDRALSAAGWILLVISVVWTVFWLLPGNFDINQSLPFHFSDALRIITAIALITRDHRAIMLSYYWGLTLNLQSIITPDLNYFRYPTLEFILYWFLHISCWLVPFALVWGRGHRPSWRGFAVAYLLSAGWTTIAFGVNQLTDANYAYTAHAPAGGSALDLLGPWPWYMLSVAVLLAMVWALMTWPWTVGKVALNHERTSF
ncbi:YwaF family protein [Corynebacterium sp. A21]|uniref:YwaF family protein n=1 Tax=Corynebacterium sp. A21 TaxID=3457318 RepID=UPI003FD170CC